MIVTVVSCHFYAVNALHLVNRSVVLADNSRETKCAVAKQAVTVLAWFLALINWV